MQIDQKAERVHLNVREPGFYNNPYPYYEELRQKTPVFYWEDYKKWTFVNHADVNAILRDRRFGRQISHVVPADSPFVRQVRPELQPFDHAEKFSLLNLEPLDAVDAPPYQKR